MQQVESETGKESENHDKSVSKDSIIRLVEKINREYGEALKRLAEIERREREDKEDREGE